MNKNKTQRKLGILLDSFSGIPKNEIEKMGYHMVPLQFSIDGIDYIDDGINPNFKKMTELVHSAKEAYTSLPTLALIQETLEMMSKEYDDVIVLPISSALSSTFETISVQSKNMENVHVFDNHLCGQEFVWVAKELEKRYQEGQSAKDLLDFLQKYNDKCLNFLIPENLVSLIRGGRLKGIKKLILTSLNLLTVLKVDQKGISLSALKRSAKSAVKKATTSLINFAGGIENVSNYDFQIIHGGNMEIVEIAEKVMNEMGITVKAKPTASATVIVHTGPGCISVGISPKIETL